MYKTAFTSTDFGYASTIAVFIVSSAWSPSASSSSMLKRKADS